MGSLALAVASLVSGCGLVCESRENHYSGDDLVPYARGVTVAQLLAEANIRLEQERRWIPDPSEYESYFGPTPPLPYEGRTEIAITVRPLSDVLVDRYGHSFEVGCEPNGSPEGSVLVTLRTSDGVLNEEVKGTLVAFDGHARVNAVVTKPKGRIEAYFAGYEPPLFPKLMIEITQTSFRLEFVLERRHEGGTSLSYVTLL